MTDEQLNMAKEIKGRLRFLQEKKDLVRHMDGSITKDPLICKFMDLYNGSGSLRVFPSGTISETVLESKTIAGAFRMLCLAIHDEIDTQIEKLKKEYAAL